jgi:hypothetical protein
MHFYLLAVTTWGDECKFPVRSSRDFTWHTVLCLSCSQISSSGFCLQILYSYRFVAKTHQWPSYQLLSLISLLLLNTTGNPMAACIYRSLAASWPVPRIKSTLGSCQCWQPIEWKLFRPLRGQTSPNVLKNIMLHGHIKCPQISDPQNCVVYFSVTENPVTRHLGKFLYKVKVSARSEREKCHLESVELFEIERLE